MKKETVMRAKLLVKQRKMRKKSSFLLIYLTVGIMLLTGCGKSEKAVEPAEQVKPNEQAEQEEPIVLAYDIIEALNADVSDIKISDTIYTSIVEDWEKWKSIDTEARALAGDMPGDKDIYFGKWNEAVDYIGIIPWNPFEGVDWVKKRNYVGTKGGKHCHFFAAGTADGELGFSFLSAGYAMDKVKIILTDYIYTINFKDVIPDQCTMVKYYQLYKENDSIKIRENTGADQDYNCMVGLWINEWSTAFSLDLKFYKDDELKYEIQLTSLESIEKLEEPFDKICTELSIPLKYNAVIE